jgi:hypothetical protein
MLDQGDALGRMGNARDPFPQPSQVVGGQLNRRQHGEQFVERQATHRHSS